jgi:hypothetical protein
VVSSECYPWSLLFSSLLRGLRFWTDDYRFPTTLQQAFTLRSDSGTPEGLGPSGSYYEISLPSAKKRLYHPHLALTSDLIASLLEFFYLTHLHLDVLCPFLSSSIVHSSSSPVPELGPFDVLVVSSYYWHHSSGFSPRALHLVSTPSCVLFQTEICHLVWSR